VTFLALSALIMLKISSSSGPVARFSPKISRMIAPDPPLGARGL
jgi:hypothetical protein